MPKWLYNWLFKLVHKNDDHVIVWNDDDTDDDKEITLLILETWVDVLADELGGPSMGPVLWDSRLDEAGVTVELRDGDYELLAAWCTIDGNWDNVPAWAKKWQDDTLGGDHNAYGRAETFDGLDWNAEKFGLVWPDGGDVRAPESSGWANIPIYGGGGRYDWFVFGGDKLVGINMPGNRHWSFFGVWRKKESLSDVDYDNLVRLLMEE